MADPTKACLQYLSVFCSLAPFFHLAAHRLKDLRDVLSQKIFPQKAPKRRRDQGNAGSTTGDAWQWKLYPSNNNSPTLWKFPLTLSPHYLQSDNKANIVHQVSIWSGSVILRSFVFIFSAWHPKKTRFMSSYCLSYVLTVCPFLLTFESQCTGDTGLWEKLSFSDRNWVSLRSTNLPLIG